MNYQSIFSNEFTETITAKEVEDLYKSICPISGEICHCMKCNMKEPKNVRVTMQKNREKNNKHELYVEASEFASFCEANNINPGEGKDRIIKAYHHEIPAIDNAEFHVVFPSESLDKNVLGSRNLGNAIKNDWALQLMCGCRRFGLKINKSLV